jgi:hypothetical protein
MSEFIIEDPTFGSDFEIGVENIKERKIIPVCGLIGGTKDFPRDIGNHCHAQEDNVMAEFNIPPVKTKEEWLDFTNYCCAEGNRILGKTGNRLQVLSSHHYEKEELASKQAATFGCSPSVDAYTGNLRCPKSKNTTLRTCGYHIHVGFPRRCKKTKNPFNMDRQRKIAKYFDLFVGIPSIILDPDNERRVLYGKAGDFRNKVLPDEQRTNVFEYRSLGGNLLKYEDLVNWVLYATKHVVKAFNTNFKLPEDDLLKNTINNSDKKQAEKIINSYNIPMP